MYPMYKLRNTVLRLEQSHLIKMTTSERELLHMNVHFVNKT